MKRKINTREIIYIITSLTILLACFGSNMLINQVKWSEIKGKTVVFFPLINKTEKIGNQEMDIVAEKIEKKFKGEITIIYPTQTLELLESKNLLKEFNKILEIQKMISIIDSKRIQRFYNEFGWDYIVIPYYTLVRHKVIYISKEHGESPSESHYMTIQFIDAKSGKEIFVNTVGIANMGFKKLTYQVLGKDIYYRIKQYIKYEE